MAALLNSTAVKCYNRFTAVKVNPLKEKKLLFVNENLYNTAESMQKGNVDPRYSKLGKNNLFNLTVQ